MMFKSKSLLALTVGAAAFAALSYSSWSSSLSAERTRSAPGPSCCAPGGSGARLTLDPARFRGPVREAYRLAGENPALFAQLHCYCGCDKTDGHKNLLDCFRDKHGSSCEICVGEALEASRLAQDGTPVEQIRDALRRRYAPLGS
jgi:hypothetical protein